MTSKLNPYFNSTTYKSEQNIVSDLRRESIQLFGQNFLYIKRDNFNYDQIMGEADLSKYTEAWEIEMFMESFDEFEGDREIISMVGSQLKDRARIQIHNDRFTEETGMKFPREGDLIYWPVTKRYFEIKMADPDKYFNTLGENNVWELTCELFEYSNEDFITGTDLDSISEDLKNLDSLGNEDLTDNEVLETESDKIEVWDETNPFGSA